MMDFNVILFDGFETLDAFGPVEIIGQMKETYHPGYFSCDGGIVTSSHNIPVLTRPFGEMNKDGVLLIPGGMSTRKLVHDDEYIDAIARMAHEASSVLTVCTGSALLARTGLLDGQEATSNKKAFEWVQSINSTVLWIRQARWVVTGKFYTSSGISAGMDMTLGFIADFHGENTARHIADIMEYVWHADKDSDPFAV